MSLIITDLRSLSRIITRQNKRFRLFVQLLDISTKSSKHDYCRNYDYKLTLGNIKELNSTTTTDYTNLGVFCDIQVIEKITYDNGSMPIIGSLLDVRAISVYNESKIGNNDNQFILECLHIRIINGDEIKSLRKFLNTSKGEEFLKQYATSYLNNSNGASK
ncbi:hypothetical protein TBLA_0C03560 [Henningerozyma blattae CBS 6284]|uniref:Telomere replication protein EST3 n=1 Tax=Henningerozyma blattae (strain ATCC 34711 / CBS 6284 / DSM 70876 / NBRC 10599 / NRRL Y-10934 / UCD 77-7) TaxID=1071380 RepID=I2H1A6_HENB6|nr:hypothetical protein TBLA_0C03560 [Tetrapisispora blattae CBS 6284]CCH60158.1 hypothetical protein TBLA_0C03560 [Tetrapisispora blattae CBS 6284]